MEQEFYDVKNQGEPLVATTKSTAGRNKRERRTGLAAREIIRNDLLDWDSSEVRMAQARNNQGTKVLNFKADPRNADLLDRFCETNGLGKALTVDMAVYRFILDVADFGAPFPYSALGDIDVLDDENVSFVISEATKNRLEQFCKANRQQSQLVVNIALQCFFDEVRNHLGN